MQPALRAVDHTGTDWWWWGAEGERHISVSVKGGFSHSLAQAMQPALRAVDHTGTDWWWWGAEGERHISVSVKGGFSHSLAQAMQPAPRAVDHTGTDWWWWGAEGETVGQFAPCLSAVLNGHFFHLVALRNGVDDILTLGHTSEYRMLAI